LIEFRIVRRRRTSMRTHGWTSPRGAGRKRLT
jgi:hypothetical protein